MKLDSFNKDLNFNDERVATSLILETSFTKEIRICLKEGQLMKEHQTPYPIVVQVLNGDLNFGVNNESIQMTTGDIITLEGAVPHDLRANKDCVVRLTLSKSDSLKRVKKVVES